MHITLLQQLSQALAARAFAAVHFLSDSLRQLLGLDAIGGNRTRRAALRPPHNVEPLLDLASLICEDAIHRDSRAAGQGFIADAGYGQLGR